MKQLDLRDTLGVLKRRWWIGALLTLLLGSLGYFYADGQTPTYGSSATVLIDFQSATQLINPLGNQLLGDPVRALQNEVRFIQSDKVLNQLFAQLGHIPNVRASSDANTDTLTFSSFSTDPEAAALEANAYAALYVKTRADRQVGNLDQATAALNGQLADLRSKLDKVPTGAADAGERSALQTQIRYYEGQVSALAVSADVGARSGATIIVAAQPSATPISPHPRRTTATAAAVGLLVGLGLALVLEYLDDTIRGAEQLSRVSPDLVLLARIPRQDSDARQHPSVASRSTQLGEAFRSLRTSIQFAGLRAPLRALQITSANPSEGKTTVACLLAVSLAQAGERVVLIDGDLRSPRVHERFGLGNEVGLSSVTLGQASLIEALQRVDDVPGLTVLASGPLPGNPADFLWSANVPDDVPTLPRLIKLLTDGGAFVIVDSPPVLPVADAMTLSRMVDGTLLVVGAGLAGSRSLLRALERLAQADANLIGQVINRVGLRFV